MTLDGGLRRQAALLTRVASRALGFRGEEGGSLVEFAIALPLMMIVLTGAASFTLAFYNLQQLGNATAGAVQAAAAEAGTVGDPCATAASSVESALPGWTTTKLSLSMKWTDSGGTVHSEPASGLDAAAAFSCVAAGDGSADTTTEMSPNTPVVLTVQYTYTWLPVLTFSPTWAPLSSTEAAMAD